MSEVFLAPIAEDDLAEIWAYIAQDNIPAADQLLERFTRAFRNIATQPQMGRTADDLARSLRVVSLGNYLVFYRQVGERIEIARVIHGARDISPEYFSKAEVTP